MGILAVTGDVGSGKSTAAHYLAEILGCPCIDADVLAKSLWDRPDIQARAIHRWGKEILGPDGKILTSKLAEHIFSAKSEHEFSCSLIHPIVMNELRQRANGDIVLEIPLLPEAGRPEWIDRAIYVTASFSVRAERCKVRGWDTDELKRRESFLLPQAERMAVCEVIVRNDGNIHELQLHLEEAT